ncbi:MAG: hypothetical protein SOY02_01325 [Candidatus Onthovivens sp.]|nr:hypothetical protein [Candidatus Onthovivens sp.]
MKDLLSLMLTTYIFVLIVGALATFVVFVLDVVKWHSSEKKSAPVPSNEIQQEQKDVNIESEVIENVTECGEPDTSVVSIFGC